MAKTGRNNLNLDWSLSAWCLRAEDIPYSAENSVKDIIDNKNAVFSDDYTYSESLGESNTFMTSFTTKTSLTVTSMPAGLYRLSYSFEYKHDGLNYDWKGRLGIARLYPMNMNVTVNNVNDWYQAGGFVHYNLTLTGTKIINLQYCTENGSEISYIRNARLEVFRVN